MASNPHDTTPEISEALFKSPCPEDTRKMPRKGCGHYCDSCEKSVVDLSQLPVEEAARTVRKADESLCVSYAIVEDGRLAFGAKTRARVAISLAAFLSACASPEVDKEAPAATSIAAETEEVTSCNSDKMIDPEAAQGETTQFAPVEPSLRLEAPQVAAPDDTWPAASSAPIDDGKTHLPVIQAQAPKKRVQMLGAPRPPKLRKLPKPPPQPAGGIRPYPGPLKTAGAPVRM